MNGGHWKTLMRPHCRTKTFWNFIMPSQGSRLQWVILSISNSYSSDFKGEWWRDWTAQSGSRKDLCDSSLWIFNEAAELVRPFKVSIKHWVTATMSMGSQLLIVSRYDYLSHLLPTYSMSLFRSFLCRYLLTNNYKKQC